MKYFSVFACSLLFVPILLAQDEGGATVQAIEGWLAKPRAERGALEKQDFSKAGLTKAEAIDIQELFWADHVAMIKETRKAEIDGGKLKIGDLEMPFEVRVFGEEPEDGRSLYISMHGGGGAPKRVNDQQWRNQIGLYQPAEGIYLAPRAPTDTWNLWQQAHIDDFFDRLIEDLIVLKNVNPDKVYLMGYSAGGDGAYQLAPRMADRFAAAAMMAGHPGDAKPMSLRNLPFTMHVGGRDRAYKRNEHVPRWVEALDKLQKADPGGYIHEGEVHEDKAHWMNLEDKVAVPWMAKFTRNPLPDRVAWKQDNITHERFYWLAIPKEAVKKHQLVIANREGQIFTIEEAEDLAEVTIRLNDEMVDMDEPIEIKMGDETLFEGKVKRTALEIYQTLAQRGDPELVFSGEVTVKMPEAAKAPEDEAPEVKEAPATIETSTAE